MSEEYFSHAVEVEVRKGSELYEKMLDIAELSGMPLETVVEVLVKYDLESRMGESADIWLRGIRVKKAPLGSEERY